MAKTYLKWPSRLADNEVAVATQQMFIAHIRQTAIIEIIAQNAPRKYCK